MERNAVDNHIGLPFFGASIVKRCLQEFATVLILTLSRRGIQSGHSTVNISIKSETGIHAALPEHNPNWSNRQPGPPSPSIARGRPWPPQAARDCPLVARGPSLLAATRSHLSPWPLWPWLIRVHTEKSDTCRPVAALPDGFGDLLPFSVFLCLQSTISTTAITTTTTFTTAMTLHDPMSPLQRKYKEE